MAKDVRVRLSHMLDCIGWIEEDTAAATLEQLAVDRRLRQLVERNLEIISEASRHIPADLKDRFSSIPWREIAGIGNILRHNYEEIAPKIMFDLIRHDLPKLRQALESLTAALDT
ncbi:MAG: HepT-like ribonuclease domain-containing protein [Rhodospirillaceae bacterium]|nr:HepT-like ribonuclease domain-containing protein [Rhodospirillaceae bacterium]